MEPQGTISEWKPDLMDRWGMSSNVFAEMSYNTINGGWHALQFLSLQTNQTNLDGTLASPNQKMDSFVEAAGFGMPLGKIKLTFKPLSRFFGNAGRFISGLFGKSATKTSTAITKNSLIQGYKVSNHAWRKSGLGRGANEELISDVITGARKAGTVITEAGTGKFSGNVIKVFNHNGVKVAVDETRQIIMSIRPEKGFKLP
jgi:hypothetical protein